MPISVAAVSGCAEEFAIMKPLLESLKTDPDFELKLYITGRHIEGRFGRTVQSVKDAGFDIAKQVDIFMQDDSAKGSARSAALAMMGFADIFASERPGVLMVHGESLWSFGAVSAASFFGLPVVKTDGDGSPGDIKKMLSSACKI